MQIKKCFSYVSLAFFAIALVIASPAFSQPDTLSTSTDPVLAMMEEARQALVNGQYDLAIKLYNKVQAKSDLRFSALALEFTGVAREKKGQLAHAKAVYQQYLKKYPLDNSAPRVRQRLSALITAASKPKAKLRKVTKAEKNQSMEWRTFGGFSQYYRYADLTIEDDLNNTSTSLDIESSLSSDLFYSVRGRGESWDVEFRLGAGYLNDFLPRSTDDDRLSELYAEIENRDWGHSFRIGRQRGKGAGVLGRFDGIYTELAISETYQLHLIYGHPVQSTNDVKINPDKKLYGINLNFGPYDGWAFTPFYVEQHSEGYVERRATGFESRYFKNGKSLFMLVDYDILFNEINTLLAIGSWRASDSTTFNASLDFRKSPVLTLSNALQGQPETSLEDLGLRFTDDELEDIARDRTTDSTLITAGVNHRFNPRWSIYSSVTMNKLSDMPASAGVDVLQGTENEWSYDVQLISSGLIKENATGIFSLRYFDGSTSQRTAANLDFRYPVNQNFRINPRVRVDLRKNTDDDTDQWIYKPSIKATYRHHKRYHFEFELGAEWTTRELNDNNEEKTQGLFGTIGYRIDL